LWRKRLRSLRNLSVEVVLHDPQTKNSLRLSKKPTDDIERRTVLFEQDELKPTSPDLLTDSERRCDVDADHRQHPLQDSERT
jgi:hypothetical protein